MYIFKTRSWNLRFLIELKKKATIYIFYIFIFVQLLVMHLSLHWFIMCNKYIMNLENWSSKTAISHWLKVSYWIIVSFRRNKVKILQIFDFHVYLLLPKVEYSREVILYAFCSSSVYIYTGIFSVL